MSDKQKLTLKNTLYGILIATLSSVGTFYITRGIAYGNVSEQITSIGDSVKDHHTKDDARDTSIGERVSKTETEIQNLKEMKQDLRDIREYLLGKKK